MRDTRLLGTSELITQSEIIDAIDRVNAYEPYSRATGVLAMVDTALGGDGDELGPEFYEASATVANAKIAELNAMVAGLRDELTAERRRVATEKQRWAANKASRAADAAAVDVELRRLRRALADSERRARRLRERTPQQGGEEPRQTGLPDIGSDPDEDGVAPAVQELSRQVAQQGLIIRGLAASLIALAGIAMLAVPLGTRWITGGWPLVGAICGGGATLVGAFACLFGRRLACALVTGIGAVVGIVVAVETFVT
jgi:hypothetical protein